MSVGNILTDWLCQSVESILRQTFTDFEFIIVCDIPDNRNVVSLLKDYAKKDNRCILICNDKPTGVAKSVNRGLKIARGKYIARMDADDVSEISRLERQYAYMEAHGDVILLGSNIHFIGNESFLKLSDNIKYDNLSIKAEMILGNCVAQSSVMIRKKALEDNRLMYDEKMNCCEDYHLWEQLMVCGKFACLKEKLVRHRLSELQISKQFRDDMKLQAEKIRGRIQITWLKRNGYSSFSADDLKYHAFSVLSRLKKDSKVKGTLEYKAFLQYVYLESKDKEKNLFTPFLNGDVRYMSIWNIARMIKRCMW